MRAPDRAGDSLDIDVTPPSPSFEVRFAKACALGHLAGAYVFGVVTILYGALCDMSAEGIAAILPSSRDRFLEGVLVFPLVTGLIGLVGAALMIPSTLLALPVAWLAARRLSTGPAVTALLGALTALPPAYLMFRDAPAPDPGPYLAAAATGATFASVIWWSCIRPRRGLTQLILVADPGIPGRASSR